MKTIEYLLWNNCPINCKFCYLKNEYQSSAVEKSYILDLVLKDIMTIKEKVNVLLVGGEIFIGLDNNIKDKLKLLYNEIFHNKNINTIYINTNILYDIEDFLIEILDLASEIGVLDRIHFTTSDDVLGRFNDKSRQLFYNNLNYLRNKYNNLNIIVNTIMSKPFCKMVKYEEYNIKDYCKKYKVKVNTIPYIDVNKLEELKPTKQEVLDTLLILKKQYEDWFYGYMDIFSKKSNMELLKYNHNIRKMENTTADKNDCGHSINFSKCFKDSDLCFSCLLNLLK